MISMTRRLSPSKTGVDGLGFLSRPAFDRNLGCLLEHLEEVVVQRMEDRSVFRAVIECVQNLERHADPPSSAHLICWAGRCWGAPFQNPQRQRHSKERVLKLSVDRQYARCKR